MPAIILLSVKKKVEGNGEVIERGDVNQDEMVSH